MIKGVGNEKSPRPDMTMPAHRSDPSSEHIILDRARTTALVIIAFAVVLFLLVQARFLLISLAVAVVLFSLTSDAIALVARQRIGVLRIPNWLASALALLMIAAALLSLTSIIIAQINTVVQTALSYTESAPAAIASMFGWLGEDAEIAVLQTINTIEISGYLRSVAGQAGALVQATVLVILFVGFLFAERVWFSIKLQNLTGDHESAKRVEDIVARIIHSVNRYLLVKTLVSAITGVIVWGVAVLFGLELAIALGVITFILNYIPSVGSIIATALVGIVAFVQTLDPTASLAIFVICGVIQFVNGNIIDPMLMGRALRLSSFGIIISLAFWGAVWGIPGMFLSVPIMVALMIVSAEIPSMRPLAVLLSREGLSTPEDDPATR